MARSNITLWMNTCKGGNLERMAGHQNLLRFGVHWQQQDCSRNLERKEGFHLKCYNSVIASLHFHHSLYTETGMCFQLVLPFLFLFWNQTDNLKWSWNSSRICGNILCHRESNLFVKILFLNLAFFQGLAGRCHPNIYTFPQNRWFLDFPFLYFSCRTDANGQKRQKRTPIFSCFGKISTSLESIPNISYAIRKSRKKPTKQYFFVKENGL